jgi:hypothetical protein
MNTRATTTPRSKVQLPTTRPNPPVVDSLSTKDKSAQEAAHGTRMNHFGWSTSLEANPAQIRYKPQHPTPPNVTRRSRRPPAAPTIKALSSVLPAALHQQVARPQPKPALAGRADLRDDQPQEPLRLSRGGQGVSSHRSPRGLPHGSPGAEPDDARTGSVEGCPRAAVWSGYARSTGRHTSPSVQDRQRSRRHTEEPGQDRRE